MFHFKGVKVRVLESEEEKKEKKKRRRRRRRGKIEEIIVDFRRG